jgi:hypothetical protein
VPGIFDPGLSRLTFESDRGDKRGPRRGRRAGVLVSPLTKALTSQRTSNEAVTLDTGEQIAIMPGLGKISPIVCLIPRLAAIMLSTEI